MGKKQMICIKSSINQSSKSMTESVDGAKNQSINCSQYLPVEIIKQIIVTAMNSNFWIHNEVLFTSVVKTLKGCLNLDLVD